MALKNHVAVLCTNHQKKLWPKDPYCKKNKLTTEDMMDKLKFAVPRDRGPNGEEPFPATVKVLIDLNEGKAKIARNTRNNTVDAPELVPAALTGDELTAAVKRATEQGNDPVVAAAGGLRLKRNVMVFFAGEVKMLWSNDSTAGVVLSVTPSYGGGANCVIMEEPEPKGDSAPSASAGLDFGWAGGATEGKRQKTGGDSGGVSVFNPEEGGEETMGYGPDEGPAPLE